MAEANKLPKLCTWINRQKLAWKTYLAEGVCGRKGPLRYKTPSAWIWSWFVPVAPSKWCASYSLLESGMCCGVSCMGQSYDLSQFEVPAIDLENIVEGPCGQRSHQCMYQDPRSPNRPWFISKASFGCFTAPESLACSVQNFYEIAAKSYASQLQKNPKNLVAREKSGKP